MSETDDPKIADGPAAPPRDPSEEERTHLLLDAVCLEDENEAEATAAPPPGPAEEAPTRLMLDPPTVLRAPTAPPRPRRSVPPRPSAALPHPASAAPQVAPQAAAPAPAAADPVAPAPPVDGAVPAASTAPATDHGAAPPAAAAEPPTHLMLGPVVPEDPAVSLPNAGERPGWLERLVRRSGTWLDERVQGRWRLVLALGGAAAIAATLADAALEPSSFARHLVALLAPLGAAAYGASWLSRILERAEGSAWRALGARLSGIAQRAALDMREFRGLRGWPKLYVAGLAVSVLGGAGVFGASLGTWLRWSSEANETPSLAWLVSGALLVLGFAGMRAAERLPVVAPKPEELQESLAAAKKLPPVVDLGEPLPQIFIEGYTPLHRIVAALSEWRGDAWPDVAGYRTALERHFRRHLPASHVEREKWLGPSRAEQIADLVIDDMVLVEVARGFAPTTAARAIAHLSEAARHWPGKPVLLVVFESTRDAVCQSAATSSLVRLHEALPLLTVRMPAPGA